MTGDARCGGSPLEGRWGCSGPQLSASLLHELRLMGVERAEVCTLVGRVRDGRGSLCKKVSIACGPPAMERMWRGLGGMVRIVRRKAW
jgi:hypothetical protein